jgi:hypothetical protein
MIQVSMKEFLRSGAFGPITLDMSRMQVQELLGPPDRLGGITSSKDITPPIWSYGDLELHYEPDADRLILIYMDNFKIPSGGNAIDLDPWIIKGRISRKKVENALSLTDIKYRQGSELSFDGVHIITSGNVVLSFLEVPNRYWPLGLYAVAYNIDYKF